MSYFDFLPIDHFKIPSRKISKPDEKNAAEWAWKKLKELAELFCSEYCRKQCHSCDLAIPLSLCVEPDRTRWEQVQREFHEALSYFYDITNDAADCPACSVAKAFESFPTLMNNFDPVPGTIDPQRVILTKAEIATIRDGKSVPLSIPCCEILIKSNNKERFLYRRVREEALLYFDSRVLPSLHPDEIMKIVNSLSLGQSVLIDLFRLRFPKKEFIPNPVLYEKVHSNLSPPPAISEPTLEIQGGESEQPEDDNLSDLSPAVRKVFALYQHAIEQNPSLNEKTTDRKVFDWLHLQRELPDRVEVPDRFDTFTRQLRHARRTLGLQKNKSRAGRPSSSGTVRSDEL